MRHFLALALAVLMVMSVTSQAQWSPPQDDSPAYNTKPPAKGEKLPPILSEMQLGGQGPREPFAYHAYQLAAKITHLIYQQPCYCRCDRNMQHKSLHSCFSSTHGAECYTCLQELYYSYQMFKLKKTASQIRQGIMHGDYRSVDLKTAISIN